MRVHETRTAEGVIPCPRAERIAAVHGRTWWMYVRTCVRSDEGYRGRERVRSPAHARAGLQRSSIWRESRHSEYPPISSKRPRPFKFGGLSRVYSSRINVRMGIWGPSDPRSRGALERASGSGFEGGPPRGHSGRRWVRRPRRRTRVSFPHHTEASPDASEGARGNASTFGFRVIFTRNTRRRGPRVRSSKKSR